MRTSSITSVTHETTEQYIPLLFLTEPRNFCLVAYLCIEVKKRNRQRGTCLSAFQNFCPFGYLLQIRRSDLTQFSALKNVKPLTDTKLRIQNRILGLF